ncbi:MAG: hypothetical protein AAGI30_13485 [Planctomycetota bacterium]
MSTDTTTSGQSFLQKHHFLLRRLHSFTGIFPIGLFLIAHLTTNSSLVWGSFALRGKSYGAESESVLGGAVAYFVKEVIWINDQIPHLLLIEIALWASIAFHSVLGFVYAFSGQRNTRLYTYSSNWRYTLQRWSGYIGILFIFYHVATLRWGWTFLIPGGTKWDSGYAASTLAMALRGVEDGWTVAGVLVSLLYFAGVTLLVFHFANGLWTSAITWGLTISRTAQRRWGYVCAALGLGLMVMGWSSLAGALLIDVEKARAVEEVVIETYRGSDEDHGAPGEPAETIEAAQAIDTDAPASPSGDE